MADFNAHLREYCERQERRRKALDMVFNDIRQYQLHGVAGLLYHVQLLNEEANRLESESQFVDAQDKRKEAHNLVTTLYEVNREVA